MKMSAGAAFLLTSLAVEPVLAQQQQTSDWVSKDAPKQAFSCTAAAGFRARQATVVGSPERTVALRLLEGRPWVQLTDPELPVFKVLPQYVPNTHPYLLRAVGTFASSYEVCESAGIVGVYSFTMGSERGEKQAVVVRLASTPDSAYVAAGGAM